MTKDELLDYVKEFLRRAIASTLKIQRDDLVGSMVSQTAVNQCPTTVMAIGYNDSLEAAADDLFGMMSALGRTAPRKKFCEKFRLVTTPSELRWLDSSGCTK